MKQIIDKRIDAIIVWFILLTPLLDASTAILMQVMNTNLPITNLIKVVFMALLFAYVVWMPKTKARKYVLYWIAVLIVYGILFVIHLQELNMGVLIQEGKEVVKYFFYPFTLLSLYAIYEQRKLPMKMEVFSYVFILYMGLIVCSTVLNVGSNAYTQGKIGEVGLFHSLNEIGAIIVLLYPFFLLQLHKMKKELLKWVIIIVCAAIFFALGSKAPLILFIVINGIYVCNEVLQLWKRKAYKQVGIVAGITVGTLIGVASYLPKTNFYANIKVHLSFLKINSIADLLSYHGINRFIFSDRLTFLGNEWAIYSQSSAMDLLFGLGSYAANSEILRKTVEMDYFDIFFKFGIIGFILYFIPVIYLLIQTFKTCPFKTMYGYYGIITLGFGLALLSGHVLSAPSVSMIVISIQIFMIQEGKKQL